MRSALRYVTYSVSPTWQNQRDQGDNGMPSRGKLLKLVYSKCEPRWKNCPKSNETSKSLLSASSGSSVSVTALCGLIHELGQASPEALNYVSELVKALLNDARGFS